MRMSSQAMDYPDVIELYDYLWNDIGKMKKPVRKHYDCAKLNEFSMEWLKILPKNHEWAKFKQEKILEYTKQERALLKDDNKKLVSHVVNVLGFLETSYFIDSEIDESYSVILYMSLAVNVAADMPIRCQESRSDSSDSQREQGTLVRTLLALFSRKDLLHTRIKLCRAMLWRCQKEKCGLETIKILVGKLVDDEEYLRERSADELSFWLKKNKPKTIRMTWSSPKKPVSQFLQCGLRMDNLPLAYDSQNLPTTEEKWNKTVFFSKPFGSYEWPSSIDVVTYASNPQLNRKALNNCEAAIVTAFEDETFYDKWIELLLVEKNDSKDVNSNTVWMIKHCDPCDPRSVNQRLMRI
ncbi:hypothetical protein DICVIV_05965 [Dictyocaulus viviparus]|uniref:Proteasome activator complex subunit 4-like HEAT repeat-like domain-containing protein n=1 Tax=Dictyocaulus viviparus TaxID=29172 RepID=A0A0D8XTU4_DICVI|nr:hypothetical protein DICVIV_05965 [Dictyocaulus viviparus]